MMIENRFSERTLSLFNLALAMISALWLIIYWLNTSFLSPDSTNYLTASQYFLEHGRLAYYVNWPSLGTELAAQPFQVQPPGFSFYLMPFIFLFSNPFLAAVVAQGVAIVLLVFVLHRILDLLKVSFIARVLFFASLLGFSSFQLVFSYLWSEPLFLLLTGGLFLSLSKALKEKELKAAFWISFAFMFFANSVRILGLFNLAFLLFPPLVKKLGKVKTVLLGVAAALPHGLWFIRNKFFFETNILAHYSSEEKSLHLEKIANFWESLKFSLGFGSDVTLILEILLIAVLIFTSYRIATKRNDKKNGVLFQFLIWVFLSQAVAFMFLTAFAQGSTDLVRPDREQLRILCCFYLFLFLAIACAIDALKELRNKIIPVAAVLLFALHMGYSQDFVFANSFMKLSASVHYPEEFYLWKDIADRKNVAEASHIYSDMNFRHQVFSKKIHLVMWTELVGDLNDPEKFRHLAKLGSNPVFIVRGSSEVFIKGLEPLVKSGELLKEEVVLGPARTPFISCYRAEIFCIPPGDNPVRFYLYTPLKPVEKGS